MLGAISLSNSSHFPISVKSMMNVKPVMFPPGPTGWHQTHSWVLSLSRRRFDRPAPAVLCEHVVEGLDRKCLQGRISFDRQEL
jgi:hypothetical protein